MSDDPLHSSHLAVWQSRKRLDAVKSRVEKAERTIALSDRLVAQAFEALNTSRDRLGSAIFTL